MLKETYLSNLDQIYRCRVICVARDIWWQRDQAPESIQSTQYSSVLANYSSHLIWDRGGRTERSGWRGRKRKEIRRRRSVWGPVGLVVFSYRNNDSHVATTCPVLSLLLLSALVTGWLCLYSIRPAGLGVARMPQHDNRLDYHQQGNARSNSLFSGFFSQLGLFCWVW